MINLIYSICSPTIASWLVEQYTIALNEKYLLTECEITDNINVSYCSSNTKRTYLVRDFTFSTCKCSCYQSQSMLLPCRHIFFVRITKILPVFDPLMVPSRFRLDFDIEALHKGSKTGNNLHTIDNLNSLSAFENLYQVIDKREKYNTLFRPAEELCNTLKY